MARKAYHEALNEVRAEVQKMAELAAEAVLKSVEALKASDIKAAKKIIKDDKKVNKLRFDIEEKCILLIATQQPMAVDLRVLTAVINIITDIERIADHAEGIAKICVMLDGEPLVKPLIDIPRMAEIGVDMLRRCMIAFEEKDVEAAKAICADDDKVDDLYDQIYRELLLVMIENPKVIQGGTYLTWVSHNLERVADRVTNIAERVVYMVTGKIEEMNTSNY